MIKKIIEFSINKPILNHIFLIFLIFVAGVSYMNISKEIFPPSSLDAVMVNGYYNGASPDILDKMAVKNIEDELLNISSINTIESTIKNGFFTVKANLKTGSSLSKALDDVKDAISQVKQDLPSDMNEPTAKIFEMVYPLVTISVSSTADKEELLRVSNELKSRFSKIKDLSDIDVQGDSDKELIFFIDEKKITAYGISRLQVVSAISNLSSIFPIGLIKERGNHLFISTINGEKEIENIKNTIVSVGAKKVRIKDICDVKFQLSDPSQISHYNGVPNISVNINKSKDGNAIALVKEIREILKTFKAKYKNFEFAVYTDTSIWIRNRLNTVISNILFGLILVGLSIFIFINGQIAFVVSVGIPVSFFIGIISMKILGYSINMLSLLGALIALGMLVDEAIVVAENIYRHLENGETPRDAAIIGATEMFPAVLTATATTIFAFLPLLIMSGEMGVFIKILPIMISILLLSSLIEAFFFLPLHAKDFLTVVKHKRKKSKLWINLNSFYSKLIRLLLTHRKKFIILFLSSVIFLIGYFLSQSKFQLFPDFDNTQIYVSGKVDINNNLEETQVFVTKVEKILLDKISFEQMDSVTSISGMRLDAKFAPEFGENNFHIFVNLHERVPNDFFNIYINPYLSPEYDDSDMLRDKTARELALKMEKLLKNLKESGDFEELTVIVPGAGIVKSDVEIALSGDNKKIEKSIKKISENLSKSNGVFNIGDNLKIGKKELKLKVNSYGYSLGFNEKLVSQTLRPFFLKAEISKMFYKDDLIKIKSQEISKDFFSTIDNFYIGVPNSLKKVRLKEIVEFEYQKSYNTIFKEDSKKISTVYASLDKNIITSKEILDNLQPLFEKLENEGVEVIIKGEEKANQQLAIEMTQASIIAMFLIFISLVWMFDSIVLPLIILSSIPLSIFGVLLGHLIIGLNLTMPGVLGIVGLSGVVVNDGIIMVDFIKKAKSLDEFIHLATTRLRPILLTSITTVLGLSTLIFFAAGQAVILQPMAISLGFGIIWATFLNLLYVPILYSIIYKKRLGQ